MLQSGVRQREQRFRVLAPCQMNHGGVWIDACIHDVSSRGVLVASDRAPERGAYVDIRRGSLIIIGRVIWRKGRFFGVRTQDQLSPQALLPDPRRTGRAGLSREAASGSRQSRPHDRLVAEGRTARRVERGRHVAKFLQFGVLASVGAAAAAFLAVQAYEMLSRPLSSAGATLDARPTG